MQSGYSINDLHREARYRWLKPAEVYFILQNHEEHQLTHRVPQTPPGGSLFLFNKRVLKFFRKDGHSWRRRKDQRTIAEAHERLKVGNVEALNCYYAHGAENPNFQRRSYWMLDPEFRMLDQLLYSQHHPLLPSVRALTLSQPTRQTLLLSLGSQASMNQVLYRRRLPPGT